MQNLLNLEDNSILIIPNNIKDKVLDFFNKQDKIINTKILTFNDIKKSIFFDYNNETIYTIMSTYNISYEIAKDYLNNLYYIEDLELNDKTKILFDIYKLLDDKNLLIKDKLFTELLKSKSTIYVFGFDNLNKFNKYILSKLEQFISINYIKKDSFVNIHTAYEFKTITEEVAYICESISKLITEGIDIKKIYIANYSDEYYFTFKTMFKRYNLPYYIKNETNLYQTVIGSYFINNIDNDLEKLLSKIKNKFDIDNNSHNNSVYTKLFNLINTYYWCNNIIDAKDLLISEMKNTKVPSKHSKYEILTTNIIDNIFDDDEYIFLIGFNLGSVPKLKRDEDYINDDIKPYYLEKTYEYNESIKETYIKVIGQIKNLTITYKLNDNFTSYSPSFLIDNKNILKEQNEFNISLYSNSFNKYKLTENIDNLIKYNEQNDNLNTLFNNYDNVYNSYNNQFSNVNNETLINKINDNISFSYSNINTYYECPFKFYVSNILKINEFETKLHQFIGSLFHHCLELCIDNYELNIDTVYQEYIDNNKNKLSNEYKNEFFLNKLKEEIKFIITVIREQYTHSKHDKVETEKRIEIEVNRKIKTRIKGFVDKILLFNNKALIIDYKTNNSSVDPELFNYGLSLQLPMYLYLLKQLDNNIEVAGMYLQHILNVDMKYDPTKDYLIEKKKKFKLDGITINDINLISDFDDTFEKSEIITALSKSSLEKGESKRILNIDDKEELISLVETMINNCIDSVSNGDFSIKPIKYGTKKDGCNFCDYKDICFRKVKDFNYITPKGDE